MVGVLQTPAVKSLSTMCCWSALLCQVTAVCGMALVLSRISPIWLNLQNVESRLINPICLTGRYQPLQAPTEIKTMGEIPLWNCEMPAGDAIAQWIRKSAQGCGGTVSIPQPAEANPRSRSISSHCACRSRMWLDLTPIHCQSLC